MEGLGGIRRCGTFFVWDISTGQYLSAQPKFDTTAGTIVVDHCRDEGLHLCVNVSDDFDIFSLELIVLFLSWRGRAP